MNAFLEQGEDLEKVPAEAEDHDEPGSAAASGDDPYENVPCTD